MSFSVDARPAPAGAAIASATSIGAPRLVVSDLARERDYWQRVVGLRALEDGPQRCVLGVEGGRPLVELVSRPQAAPRPAHLPGLFHVALLVPGRPELAQALRRIEAAGERLTGASDHLVSEAIYLRDPEGNGIEIYRDRPREEWPYEHGAVRMTTEPLDLDAVLAELPQEGAGAALAPATSVGHVHLQVGDLAAAEAFYHGLLGFDITVRGYPGALFLSAGGYHHHVGLNTWRSAGSPPAPEGVRGLALVRVVVPAGDELERIARRAEAAGAAAERHDGALQLRDPSGNVVALSVAASG